MIVGEISQLWRFPVKSLQGEAVDTLELGPTHVVGDREWALVDTGSGTLMSAKRWGALLDASARTEVDRIVITLPGGDEHPVGDPATDVALSDWLGRPVRLAQPGRETLSYEMHTDPLDDGSDLFEWPAPAEHFADLAAAHLLTTASLRAAADLHPDGDWDIRRFRPTALVEADGDGFVEDAWVGHTTGLGADATVSPFMPTIRCAMPTRAQPGLPRDLAVARVLTDHHQSNLGVYCGPGTPGVVSIGDPVTLTS